MESMDSEEGNAAGNDSQSSPTLSGEPKDSRRQSAERDVRRNGWLTRKWTWEPEEIGCRDVSEVVQNGAKAVRRYNYCRAL